MRFINIKNVMFNIEKILFIKQDTVCNTILYVYFDYDKHETIHFNSSSELESAMRIINLKMELED